MLDIVEVFSSWQGEGRWTGHAMTFIRLAGCNLRCHWCDQPEASYAERIVAQQMTENSIITKVEALAPKRVCVTGGEPLLQDVEKLFKLLTARGYKLHLETNGTMYSDLPWDWVTVSPKSNGVPDEHMYDRADELKFIVDEHFNPALVVANAQRSQIYLQPCNDFSTVDETSLKRTLAILRTHPEWALSVQLHKIINVR